MPSKAPDSNVEDAVNAYLEGANVLVAARAHHVGSARLSGELKKRGLMRPVGHAQPATVVKRMENYGINSAEVAALYRAGVSEKALAEKYRTSRQVIAARLRVEGVERRDRSAAQQLRIDSMTDAEIGLLVRNMHLAFEADGEDVLDTMLRARGLNPVPQLPTGRYNIDRAVLPVAMEVHARRHDPLDRAHRGGYERKRIHNLTDWGWHVHYIWTPGGVISDAAADDAVAFYERVKGAPAAPGEYRVVRGSGELVASGRGDLY